MADGQAMESERQAASVLSTAVAQTSAALAKMREKSKALEEEIAAVRNETRAERATKERAADALDGQRQRDLVEVEAFQNALGLSITSCGGKRLLIVFTSIDPARPKREFMFVFDMGSEINAVPQCDPPLPQMNELVRQFNADHDLSAFIKRGKSSFCPCEIHTLTQQYGKPSSLSQYLPHNQSQLPLPFQLSQAIHRARTAGHLQISEQVSEGNQDRHPHLLLRPI